MQWKRSGISSNFPHPLSILPLTMRTLVLNGKCTNRIIVMLLVLLLLVGTAAANDPLWDRCQEDSHCAFVFRAGREHFDKAVSFFSHARPLPFWPSQWQPSMVSVFAATSSNWSVSVERTLGALIRYRTFMDGATLSCGRENEYVAYDSLHQAYACVCRAGNDCPSLAVAAGSWSEDTTATAMVVVALAGGVVLVLAFFVYTVIKVREAVDIAKNREDNELEMTPMTATGTDILRAMAGRL